MAAGDDSAVPLGTPTGSADTRLNAAGDHRQVIVNGNAFDGVVGMDLPTGSMMVNQGPNTLFIDGWAGSSLDTTDRWTVVAGTAPTVAGGVMTMPATVSTYNAIQTKGSMPYTLGFQYMAMGITLETTAAVGAGRFWGMGTFTGTPTATRLVTDGIGFEIDQATGALLAVTYSGGTRTTIATLTRPGDNAIHRYALYWRPTAAHWFIDNLQVAAASTTFPSVPQQELPVLVVRQNAASFTGTPTFTNIAAAVGDTSRMGNQIQDGAFPWRKAKVGKSGGVAVIGEVLPAVTGAIGAGTTGTIGPVDVSEAGNASIIAKNTVANNAWTGNPVLVFEQSDDGVSWGTMTVVRNDNGAAGHTFVLSPNTASATVVFDAAIESVAFIRVRVTTGPATNGMTVSIASGGLPFLPVVTSIINPVSTLPMGTTSGTTPALAGQVGRMVRASGNVAQATAAVLIAAPAAGTRIYITNIFVNNEGATLTTARLFAGALPSAAGAVAVVNDVVDIAVAPNGGGATLCFGPGAPWALPAATALSFAVTAATTWGISVTYYVAT